MSKKKHYLIIVLYFVLFSSCNINVRNIKVKSNSGTVTINENLTDSGQTILGRQYTAKEILDDNIDTAGIVHLSLFNEKTQQYISAETSPKSGDSVEVRMKIFNKATDSISNAIVFSVLRSDILKQQMNFKNDTAKIQFKTDSNSKTMQTFDFSMYQFGGFKVEKNKLNLLTGQLKSGKNTFKFIIIDDLEKRGFPFKICCLLTFCAEWKLDCFNYANKIAKSEKKRGCTSQVTFDNFNFFLMTKQPHCEVTCLN